jgi:putative ABC transport system permease protein
VIDDLPGNVHMKFNGLISMATFAEQVGAGRFNDRSPISFWNVNLYSYVLVKENSDINDVLDKFPVFYDKYMKEIGDQISGSSFSLMVTPLDDVHLNPVNMDYDLPKGNRSNVYIFSMAALFILLIACINYMNMATARSARRAKEVGLRKVTGAHKHLLVSQFLGESVIITLFSFIISVLLVKLLLPLFNDLSAKHLAFGITSSTALFLGSLLVALIIGLLSGSYPAFYLSSFSPVTVLKGTVEKTGGKAYLRKGLVLVQFTISVILIIGTMAVSGQLKFMKTTDLGFDKDNIIVMTVRDTTIRKSYESFKAELLTNPDILSVALSTSSPGRILSIQVARMEGDSGSMVEKALNNYFIDYDYLDMMGIKIVEGRNYEKERGTDASRAFIINETGVRDLGWTGAPLGKRFQWNINLDGTAGRDGEIIGVFKDYHYGSLHNKIEPLVLLITDDYSFMPFLNIRTTGKNQQAAIEFIDRKRKEFGDQYPFDYTFLTEDLDKYYQEEAIIGKIFRYFTILTIFIASLGLLGLSAFMAQQRTKEIGIRKVAGSSVNNIILLFLKDFTFWVLVANVIGMVVAWFGINRWLQDFQYRIDISVWLFLSGLVISLLVAWITVTWQSVRAALANPAVSLRYE